MSKGGLCCWSNKICARERGGLRVYYPFITWTFFAFNFQNLIIGVIFNISFIEYYYILDFLNSSEWQSTENEKRPLKSRNFVFNFFFHALNLFLLKLISTSFSRTISFSRRVSSCIILLNLLILYIIIIKTINSIAKHKKRFNSAMRLLSFSYIWE